MGVVGVRPQHRQEMAAKQEKARKLIALFCKRINSSEVSQESLPLGLEVEEEGKGLGFICRCIVEAAGSPAADQLLGTTPEMQAEVSQWLSFASSFSGNKLNIDGRLKLLNVHLENRSVFAGRGLEISVADLSMFAVVHDIVTEESFPELVKLPHLLRWIDYIQSKDEAAKVYPHIPVEKAKFDPPRSSPAATASKGTSVLAISSSVRSQTTTTVSDTAASSELKAEATNVEVEVSKAVEVSDKNDKKAAAAAAAAATTVGGAQGDEAAAQESSKKVKKEKPPAQKKESDTSVSVLDIRVGLINKVWKHPGADALYVEEIDIGEGSVRQVVSGLAKFLTPEQMLNRKVLVLRNVKPGKVRDVLSSGLVLCASNSDHSQCEPVLPPEGSKIGERVTVSGYEGSPEEVLNPKKKQFEKIQPDLTTDDSGIANYQGKPFMTTAGPCRSSILNGTIK